MTPNAYQKLALRTMADQEAIRLRNLQYGPTATQIDTAVRGLANEVGEIAEAVKNWLEYGKSLDAVNMKEEVGDVLWRLAQLCDACGFTLEDAMESNIRKLAHRFGDKYSDRQADPANRDRGRERTAVSLTPVPELERKAKERQAELRRKIAADDGPHAVPPLPPGVSPSPTPYTDTVVCGTCRAPLSDEVTKVLEKDKSRTFSCPNCQAVLGYNRA